MAEFLFKTRGNSTAKKLRVYFTCHPDDFERYFERISDDILKAHDCIIYYTADVTAEIEEQNKDVDLGQMNLFVIPVTLKLLTDPNRAMDSDYRYAKEKNISILPMMMESGMDAVYARPDKFGEMQYINPFSRDTTGISYEEKLKKFLESVMKIAVASNDDDPEHNFHMGLAYFEGIDVEVDKERGIELITKAAEAELPEAMWKLYNIYDSPVFLDYRKAVIWAEKLVDYCKRTLGEEHPITLTLLNNLTVTYYYFGEHKRALELQEKVYAARCRVLGEDNPDTLEILTELEHPCKEIMSLFHSCNSCSKPASASNSLIDSKHIEKKDTVPAEKMIIPPPQVDSVQFSAVAANKVVPGKYVPINIVMYADGFRKAVDDIINSYGKNAKESKSGYHDVKRSSVIKVVLSSPDVGIEDSVEEQTWNGKYLNFGFAVKIPRDFSEEQILISAVVFVNDIITTRLKLILDCDAKPRRNISVTRYDIISAFVSYASQDRNRVASIIQGMKKARPDLDIFFDVESLRSGQKWEEALKNEIENRDILFLCWSKHAKDSKWVDMEWRYALKCKGEDGVEPIPIDPPNACPPPAELNKKHFNDRLLYIINSDF